MPIYYNIPEIGQILRVVEESDHPVDGGEGDDVDQDYHVACSDIFWMKEIRGDVHTLPKNSFDKQDN